MAVQPVFQEQYAALHRTVRGWDRRLRAQQTLLWLPRSVIPGLVVGLAVAILSRLRPWLLPRQIALTAGVAVAVGVVVMLVAVWAWRRPALASARRFDVTFGLGERVSTALELIDGRIRASDELAALQVGDAWDRARAVRAGDRIPFAVRGREWVIALLLAALLVALVVLPNAQAEAIIAGDAQKAAIEDAADTVRDITEKIAADPTLGDPERKSLLEALDTSLQTLEKPDITPEEAFATLSDVQSSLQQRGDALSQQADASRSGSQAASDALRQALEQAQAQRQQQEQQTQSLQDMLNSLAQSLPGMNQQQQQQAAQGMQQASQALNQTNPQASQQMQQASQALQNGQIPSAQNALQQAQQSVQQGQQQQQNAQASAQQMQQSAQQAQQAAGQVAQAGQTQPSQQSQQGQQSQNQQGQQGQQQQQTGSQSQSGVQQSQAGQQAAQGDPSQQQAQSGQQAAQSGQAQPNAGAPAQQGQQGQQGQTGQQGQSSQGQQGQQGQQAAQGSQMSGTGAGAGDSVDGGGSQQQGSQQQQGPAPRNNAPDGQGLGEFAPVYAPQRIGGDLSDQQMVLEPDGSSAPVIQGEFAQNPNGSSVVPYNQVYGDYANNANRALESDYIPLGMRDVVRDYFSSLDPSSGGGAPSGQPAQ